jgi:hypothetical protein
MLLLAGRGCGLLRPAIFGKAIKDGTANAGKVDGWVSLEVSPPLARGTLRTVDQAEACAAGPPWTTCSSRSLEPRRACPGSRSASAPRSR